MAKTLAVTLAGPVCFLVAVIGVSVWLAAIGVPPDEIPDAASDLTAYVLVIALSLLGVVALGLVRSSAPVRRLWTVRFPIRHILIGAAVGVGLGVSYIYLLNPLHEWLQASVGDYVPPGETTRGLATATIAFFVANVVLAPVVEETIYRGWLIERWGSGARAAILSCVAFGLLHWLGGVWYMALTAVVAGGAFCLLRFRTGALLAPFACHLTLNLVEFLWLSAR
jgi:membrane protease YdiL (CAAX protease family)